MPVHSVRAFLGDAAKLAGVHRNTSAKWRNAGIDYLDDPEAHPEDARFGLYAERIEEAELKAEILLIERVARDPDWRSALALLKARYKTEFAELSHTQSEISGPAGAPIEVHQTNPFQVSFHLDGPRLNPRTLRSLTTLANIEKRLRCQIRMEDTFPHRGRRKQRRNGLKTCTERADALAGELAIYRKWLKLNDPLEQSAVLDQVIDSQ